MMVWHLIFTDLLPENVGDVDEMLRSIFRR
jgi:hypothetical protein